MSAKGLAVLCWAVSSAVTIPSAAWAQAATAALQSTLGTVTKIDAATRTLSVKTEAGQEFAVSLQEKATVQRIPPGQTDINKAETIQLSDVSVGDRVLARGTVDSLKVSATRIVVMSQGDIVKKQEAERADWDKRGVTGLVTAVASNSVTISVKNLTGSKQVAIALAPNAIVRRYAPDSVKFADAKTSTLPEIKIGDQVRARGDKTPDGGVSAEEVVSGTFKTIAGVILSIDAQEKVMQVRDLETKKPLTVKIIPDSSMKKFQPQDAQQIALRLHPELAQAGGAGGGRGGRGQGGGGGGGRNGDTQGGRGRGPADLQQLLDRSPVISVTDLKAGDAIVVSSTVGASADKITAISLVAGVEPIITKPGTQEMSLGDWNLAGGGGGIAQ